MKSYIEQLYTEGLATTFYLKPVNLLKRRISNQKLLKFLMFIVKILYTIFIFIFVYCVFLLKYPL